MAFINEHFMLNNETGKHLYHDFAKDMPIYDYHCHLDPSKLATMWHVTILQTYGSVVSLQMACNACTRH